MPKHVAVIMDGNGRWAKSRGQPRSFGHRAGVKSARRVISHCNKLGIEALTLFAFSQENWQRPEQEVTLLLQLFIRTLAREARNLHKNNIRLRFIGEHGDFPQELQASMKDAVALTANNTGPALIIAVGYGGQWDIVQAAQKLAAAGKAIDAEALEAALSTSGLPLPDLLIRTGGESRISNFLLWQIAYSELYFCDTLWPDFDEKEFEKALAWFAGRERRFGRVPEGA
ncbi:MAG TPA: polyprenyl diphosphate synthase [Nevskiaceae bacterium]|nr:polyprenyl diphosphate synthase [Nevskiaceae bacterium]